MSDGYRKLMISVLLTQIQDYILNTAHGAHAENYIFRNDKESDEYVFGFNFICRYIELDPERLRKRIKVLRKDKKALKKRR